MNLKSNKLFIHLNDVVKRLCIQSILPGPTKERHSYAYVGT
jgi:hypothetical protein